MTKPIILVKICYKLLYVIQGVKKIFDKPQLISKFLVIHTFTMLLLITFFTPRVFLFNYLF